MSCSVGKALPRREAGWMARSAEVVARGRTGLGCLIAVHLAGLSVDVNCVVQFEDNQLKLLALSRYDAVAEFADSFGRGHKWKC